MLSFIKFAALVGPFIASSYAQTLDIATTTSSGLPSTITTSLHVPSEFLEFWGGYAGSVVAAYVDRTTFAFGCGSSCLTAAIWATMTIVKGPTIFSLSAVGVDLDEHLTYIASCNVLNYNIGVCTYDDARSNAKTTSTTGRNAVVRFSSVAVTLTAGVSKLASATATYNPTPGNARLASAPKATPIATTQALSGPIVVISGQKSGAVSYKSHASDWMALTIITGIVTAVGGLLIVA